MVNLQEMEATVTDLVAAIAWRKEQVSLARAWMPDRALSIRQPWAHLIFHGSKRVENRSRNIGYRERFWIHSSEKSSFKDWGAARFPAHRIDGITLPDDYSSLPHGFILGWARCDMRMNPGYPAPGGFDEWRDIDAHGYVLNEVVRIPNPVPCKGALGFWRVPADVLAQLKEQF